MLPQNVRRNQITQQSSFSSTADPRYQSTPQPIPQNPSLNQFQQRGPAALHQYNFSPKQSPQHAHYPPSMPHSSFYMNVSNELNASNPSMIGQSPSVKPHANGQHLWSPQPLQYGPQGQHQQPQNAFHPAQPTTKFNRPNQNPYQGYSHNASVNPPILYNSGRQRFSAPNPQSVVAPSAHPSISSSSHFYQQQTYYPNQMQQMGYPQATYDAPGMYSPGNQQLMPSSQVMMQPQVPISVTMQHQQTLGYTQPRPTRKAITIKDPNTMQDVTKDILDSGRIDNDPMLGRSPSATTVISSQSEISYPPRLTTPFKSMPPGSLIPDNVDTSVPPPPLQSISPLTVQLASQPISNLPMQPPLPPMQNQSRGLSTSSPKPVAGLNQSVVSQAVRIAPGMNTRPDAPVAVVQPVPNTNLVFENIPSRKPLDSESDKVNQKIEDISVTSKVAVRDDVVQTSVISEVETADLSKMTETASQIIEELNPTYTDESLTNITPEGADVVADVQDDSSIDQAVSHPTTISSIEKFEDVLIDSEETDAPVLTQEDIGAPILLDPTPTVIEQVSLPQTNQTNLPTAADKKENITFTDKSIIDQVSNTDVDAPLSSGDSFMKETGDKISYKTPEGEKFTDQPRVSDPNKEISSNETTTAAIESELSSEVEEVETQELVDASQDCFEGKSRKRIYDRDFLMQFRYHPSTMEKPIGLPRIDDIIREGPLPKSSISSSPPSVAYSDFSPTWMTRDGSKSGRTSSWSMRQGQQRSGYRYPNQQVTQKLIITKPIQKEPELNKAENAWKPSKLEAKPSTQTEEAQTEEVLKSVRAILNKLTPQNFPRLMMQLKQLPINSEVRLKGVIDLIFEKAIDEPNFSEAYANMCREMSQFKVAANTSSGPTQQQTFEFRKLLLTRCQREFEKDRANESLLGDLRAKIEEAKSPEEKQLLKEELEMKESKERRRMLGNIRFIGELFKLQMLTESIMHNCLIQLFKKRDDESLESLCRLMMTIGKLLDHAKGKLRMDQYFTQIDKIINERKTSSRVRFMLQDVKDMRLNNWVPRSTQLQGPKTIDQIHKDAKEEKEQYELQAAANAAAIASGPIKNQSRGNRMGSRGSGGHNFGDDGWTKVQKPMRIDPLKMKLSKYDESMTLGPNRGKMGWKSGSGSATRTGSGGYSSRDSLDGITPRSSTPTTMNRFSALHSSGGPDSPYSQRAGGRVSSQERTRSDSRGSTGSGKGSGRDERQSALDTVKKLTSSERKASMRDRSPAKPSESNIKIDEKTVIKKITSTIEEYLDIHDIKEATLCFDELNLPISSQFLIVRTCLEVTIEKSSAKRFSISKLLNALVRNGKIEPKQYLIGVKSHMELAIDLQLDLPKVWFYLAEQIASIFYESDGKIPFFVIKEITLPLLEAEKAHLFVIEVLKLLIQQQGLDSVLNLWRSSYLSMDFFLSTNMLPSLFDILRKHQLENFYGVDEPRIPDSGKFNRFVDEIRYQLKKDNSNDSIQNWIERNVSPDEKLEPAFIRALTTAVCDHAILQSGNESFILDERVLSPMLILLKRYINDEAMELQAIFALQRLFVKLEQPQNILKQLFAKLYDDDIITDQTFYKWEEDENPLESEGKSLATLSVKPFISWLRSSEPDSD